MSTTAGKLLKILLLLLVLAGIYALATHKHKQREDIRQATVTLTPGCAEKLRRYGLARSERYRSPYVLQRTGTAVPLRGYSDEDIRAIQRGCNIIDDTQGKLAQDPALERWNTTRFIRGSHTSCDHCHQLSLIHISEPTRLLSIS